MGLDMSRNKNKQIRISDAHLKELESLAEETGLRKPEILGIALGMFRALRDNNAKKIKVVNNNNEEVELVLSVGAFPRS